MKFSLGFKRGRGGGNKLDLKQYLFQHAEKILLGLAGLFLLVLLVLGSRSGSDFDAQRAPKDLASLVRKAEDQISRTAWDVYRPQRDRTDRRPLTARAEDALQKVSVDSYPTPVPLKPLIFPPQTKRSDPELLPVRDLAARAGYGAIAVRPEGTEPAAQQVVAPPEVTRPLPQADELELPEASELVGGGNAKGVHFVCLTGRIPFREQLAEYTRCFANAAEYHAAHDYPHYFTFRIQRAEIPLGGGEPQWVTLPFPSLDPKSIAFRESWSGRPPELADSQYIVSSPQFVDTAFLLPPLMGEDLKKWAVHDGIPLAKTEEYDQRPQPAAETTVKPGADDPFGQSDTGGALEEPTGEDERASRGGRDWRSQAAPGAPRWKSPAAGPGNGMRTPNSSCSASLTSMCNRESPISTGCSCGWRTPTIPRMNPRPSNCACCRPRQPTASAPRCRSQPNRSIIIGIRPGAGRVRPSPCPRAARCWWDW